MRNTEALAWVTTVIAGQQPSWSFAREVEPSIELTDLAGVEGVTALFNSRLRTSIDALEA